MTHSIMAIHRLDWQGPAPAECRGGALTIGNFDGVHRGHAALLAETLRLADALAGPAVALTFDPHPLQILRPDSLLPPLTTTEDRAELLASLGTDHVIILGTTPELLHLSAEEFLRRVVRENLDARALVEGVDFRFGHNREGNVSLLEGWSRTDGMKLSVVPPVMLGDQPVSSSRVRAVLHRGQVEEARQLLDRPYRLRGRVAVGERRGRTLGFPTANLDPLWTLAPGDGVYAVRGWVGGKRWPGAANVGPNPTFGEQARKVEVHLIGFSGDLYGTELAVDFLARLRDTRPFAGAGELREQLRRDVDQARRLAAEHP
jgi:riboflavin kinase/FMN adenylyltransferase